MASPVQFAVDDSSPVLAYAPFADTLDRPDLAAGWNPYFVGSGFVASIGQTGIGESQHITSRNGSSISLRWHGTSLQLFGNTTADASLSLVLDGISVPQNTSSNTPNLLAFLDGLEHSDHALVLTALTPSDPGRSLVVFDKAVITDPPPQNSSNLIFSDHTLADNDISFTGPWSQLTFPPARESTSQGDTAQVTFSGIAIRIFGTTSPSSGNYSITLDDIQSPIFSGRSSFTQYDSLLFFASGLDPDVSHHIIIRNEGGSLQLKSGGSGFDIFSSGEPTALPSPSPPSSSSPANTPSPSSGIGKFAKGTIAALVLAGFLAAVLLTAVLFYFCIWRPRRRKRGRQQQLDAVQEATSQLRRNPKEVQNNSVGAVLDIIGQQRHPDDIPINSPVDVLVPVSPISPNTGGPCNERQRDSKQSTGFARWKRDLNALSGLTNLGLKFRHDDSDEKSPLSDNGRGERRYMSEVDDVSPTSPSVGRMMSLTTQSSYRSLRRLGKKRSAGNNGGRGGGFPFRLNSGRSSSNNGGRDGEGPTSPRTRDEDSLSGLTSLSYASNPNLEGSGDIAAATATTTLLDVQPPSYAASISQHTTSGSSSGNLSPRVGSKPPSATQLGRDVQERQPVQSSSFEQQQQRLSSSSSSSGNQSRRQLQRSDTRMRGIRMLGLGGGSTSTGGVGSPISMRAAIRGLSPRISRNQKGGGGKEREVVVEEEHDQAASSQHSIALASIGHTQYEQERREDVEIPPVPSLPVMTPERRKADSPIRALPPIPIPAATATPVSEVPSRVDEQRQQRGRRDVNITTTTVPPPTSAPSPSSPPSSSSSRHSPTRLPPIVTTTTTAEKRPFVSTKVARSSLGDAVGLPPLGAIQSFSEAAAIAINTGGIQLGEGSDSPAAVGDAVRAGEGQREGKRSSTASRVRFEEPSATASGDDSTIMPIEGNKRRKGEKTEFRLTPPTPITGGSPSSPEYPPLIPAVPATSVAEYGRSSFLDLSSQPPSLRSAPSVHRNDNHDFTDDDNDNDNDNNDNHKDRIWSMQLPGRHVLYPPPPSSPSSEEERALKSKWSNTTMQTVTRTLGGSLSSSSSSSNNHSGYRSRQRVRPPSTVENEGDVLSPTTRQNLFPFPLAIPPSPNMPEGFTGVEPSPSLMSPTVSLPVSFSSRRKEGKGRRSRRFLGVAGFGRGRDDEGEGDNNHNDDERPENIHHLPSLSRHTGHSGSTDVTNSPTDSFPYSISDVHFRNSGVSVPDEEDGGQLGSGLPQLDDHGHTRHRHHHQPPPHPPLPSLTPQRFSPSLSQQSQSTPPVPSHPSLRSLTPQRFDPYLSQHHPPQPTPPSQQQQHERTQSFTSSIVQRVFGMR